MTARVAEHRIMTTALESYVADMSTDVRRRKKMKLSMGSIERLDIRCSRKIMSRTWNRETGRIRSAEIHYRFSRRTSASGSILICMIAFGIGTDQRRRTTHCKVVGLEYHIGVGSAAMLLCVDKVEATVLSRTTVQHVTDDELKTVETRQIFDELDKSIDEKLDDTKHLCAKPDLMIEHLVELKIID